MNLWDFIITAGLIALVFFSLSLHRKQKGGCSCCDKENCAFRNELYRK